MKNVLKNVVLMAALAMSFSAQATIFGANETTNNNQTYIQPASHATANGGAGGQGGSSVATGGNATGGAVIGSGNSTNSIKTDVKNTNSNTQGQQQAISNSGNSSSQSGVKNSGNSASTSASNSGGNTQSNAGNNTSVNVEGDRYEAQKRAPVSTAYSAGLTATNGTCFGSASAGVQLAGFAVTGGSTTFDDNCDRRYDAQELRALGMADAALALMCQKAAVAEAMKASNKPCPTAKAAPGSTPVATTNTASAKYEYTDPIVRARLNLPPLK